MATGDLTTVEKVRTYLNLTSLDADAKLGGLISSSSAWVTSQIGHPILSATYTETVNGNGTTSLVLRRSPVVSVTSVTVDGDERSPVEWHCVGERAAQSPSRGSLCRTRGREDAARGRGRRERLRRGERLGDPARLGVGDR